MEVLDYYRTVEDDLVHMSPEIIQTDFSWMEYMCAISVMRNTRLALRGPTLSLERDDRAPIVTALGRRILKLYQNNVPIISDSQDELICCEEAEWKLAHSMSESNVRNRKRHSPLLLTLKNKAVAVGKQWGEPSWYGLADVPKHGIYTGAFSSIRSVPQTKHFPVSDTAYRYELQPDDVARTIRFSLFATPLRYRQHLRTFQYEAEIVTRTTHQDIVARAQELLDDATQLTPQ